MRPHQSFALLCLLLASATILSACGSNLPSHVTESKTTVPTNVPSQTLPLKANGRQSLGYYTGSTDSWQSIQLFADQLTIVSADVYAIDADGKISGSDPYNVAAFDRDHGILTFACVSNYNSDLGDFDPKLAEVGIVTYKEETITALVDLAASGGYDGVNIDFESIHYSEDIESDRAAFTGFIDDLAGQLHAKGLKLIISVPAKTSDNPADDWSYPFNLAALGQKADYLQVMTYDEHGPWSEPGAVSGADWVENVLIYSIAIVDPAKLLIGLPAYGYDWTSDGSNDSVTWKDAPALLSKMGAESHWDETTQSPWLTYTENDISHTLWYENGQSISAKARLVNKYNLGGWSVWALGYDNADFWKAVFTN
jgi:spore germination protein YaaH